MATIKDVAKKANVSVATVSRVINNTGYVNTETRNMVLEAIQSLDYIPNELARSLFKKQSNIIGMVVPHLTTLFYGELIEAIEEALIKKEFKLMIFNSRDDLEREQKFLSVFNQYNITGIILVAHLQTLQSYLDLDIPIVAIDHHVADNITSVSSDNVMGGRLAAEHFIASGAKKVIHFRGPSFLLTVKERDQGFKETLKKAKVVVEDYDLDFNTPNPIEIKDMILKHQDAEAIFCDGDLIAMHVLRVLNELGITCPEKMEVIGYDNLTLSAIVTPSLSSIDQPIEKMADAAVDLLLKIVAGDKDQPFHQNFPVSLVKRESTKH